MADTGGVRIEGLDEFIADLKRAPKRVQRVQADALKSGARKIAARAAAYAPRKSGKLADRVSIRVTANRVTITWLQPYAGVQEFAVDYTRGGPRPGPVHLEGSHPPPRFAYRARDELAPGMANQLLDDVAQAAAAGGWFEVRG